MSGRITHDDTARLAQLQEAYRQVWTTPEGKKVLGDIISFGGFFSQAGYGPSRPNPYTLYREQGRRDVGIHIGAMLKWGIEDFVDQFSIAQNEIPSIANPSFIYDGQD